MLYAVLGLALLAADQWSKFWVVNHLALGQSAPFWPGVVELLRVHNYGAAWSSFSGQRWLLVGMTGVITAAVVFLLARRIVRHPLGVTACTLILAGGVGNIIDRVRLGYVVDMLHFQFWPDYPVFNGADICVVCGAALGALYYLRYHETCDQGGQTDGDKNTSDAA